MDSELSSVHISQFYPCSEIKLACELYYIVELGKYSSTYHKTAVSLRGVVLNPIVKKARFIWDYFRIAVKNGWLVDTSIPNELLEITLQNDVMATRSDIANFLFTTEKAEPVYGVGNMDIETVVPQTISFESMLDEKWVWTGNGADGMHYMDNNKALNHDRADQSWLSLLAYVAVNRVFRGSPDVLRIEFSQNFLLNSMAMSYVLLLADEVPCFTWVDLDCTGLSVDQQNQLTYMSWYAKGRDLGMCDRWYSGVDKLRYMKQLGIGVGDLVMFYERNKAQQRNYIKSIASCHLAKVVSVDKHNIAFEFINTVKPYYMGKMSFEDNSTIVKKMYRSNTYMPYERLNTSKQRMDLADLGVEYMLYTEHCFITPLCESDDIRPTLVSDGDRVDNLLLHQNDLIYWILKDYNYEFNEKHFLEQNFAGREPLYTRYMRGEVLEPECYARV